VYTIKTVAIIVEKEIIDVIKKQDVKAKRSTPSERVFPQLT